MTYGKWFDYSRKKPSSDYFFFQLLMYLAPQRITWLVCYLKKIYYLTGKKTGSWLRTQHLFTALWWSSSNVIIWIEVTTWLDKCPRLCQFKRLIAAVVRQNCFKLSNTASERWLRIYALLITVIYYMILLMPRQSKNYSWLPFGKRT